MPMIFSKPPRAAYAWVMAQQMSTPPPMPRQNTSNHDAASAQGYDDATPRDATHKKHMCLLQNII